MKKKLFACLMAAVIILSLFSAAAFAQTDVDLGRQDGRLTITEPGSYVLQGKLTGQVYVDPREGDVELVLDGADIDGGAGGGIVAVSGDSLTLRLPEGSVNRVVDGGADTQFGAAIYSKIETVFDGPGSLYITGSSRDGIRVENAGLTFNGGSFAIKAPDNGLGAQTLTFNGGSFSIQARNNFDPAATVINNGGIFQIVAPDTQNIAYYNDAADVAQNNNTCFAGNLFPGLFGSTEQGGQQPLEIPGGDFNGQQPPEIPGGTNGQQPPEIPGGTNGQQPPEMPDGDFSGQQPPEMTGGNFNGQQPGGFQQTWESASSASEIVNGTMTNSAASLEADYANASYITVTDDDSQVKISSSGTYVVSGESSDGNITVKKGTTGVVLVLDDLDLTSTTGAAVSINKEAEVKVIISGNVVLTDNENPDDENSEDADVADAFDGAAFKTKANSQVYVTGDGTLTINGNAKNGIKAGDDSSLIFDGVTVNINAVNDGINGNYDVTLLSGNFTIEAGDDAIHADHILTVGSTDGSGPTIRVTGSNEGLEGTVVNILGGDVSIVSKDDAINAANGDGLYEGVLDYSFNMTGGRVLINSQGDGVDSNGNINLMGGSMEIHSASMGGEAGLDYDGQLYIADDFSMNNQSGVADPDGMPGQMGGQQPGQMGGPGGSQGFGGQQPGQSFGGMGGGFGGQTGGPGMGGSMPGRP
ncbi:MAG: carbohydrate-binding domain-containing protein [Oscillospiraceae bacterium]|nr:carbohydrate-binding domain-containing protein [Oscillospiraceae bacterium]